MNQTPRLSGGQLIHLYESVPTPLEVEQDASAHAFNDTFDEVVTGVDLVDGEVLYYANIPNTGKSPANTRRAGENDVPISHVR